MKEATTKIVAPAMSLLMVAGAGAGVAGAVVAPDTAQAVAVQREANQVASGQARACAVQIAGEFAFSQAAVTPNATISEVFAKAAATLCASMPAYSDACACQALLVSAPGAFSEATVGQLSAGAESSSYTLACACATNAPGGGAVANADVSGLSLAGLARAMGVR